MLILMGMNVPYTRSHGGANRSNRALLEGLAARGHHVSVVTPALASPSEITYEQWRERLAANGIAVTSAARHDSLEMTGVQVTAVRDSRLMRSVFMETVQRLAPDWTLVASEDPSQSLLSAALEARNSRVAYMALTPQLFPFGPESLYPGKERTALVQRCALICCLSHSIAAYIKQYAGVPAHLYHPPHFGRGEFPHFHNFESGAVLLMNASAVKGFSIFVELAREFPVTPFAVLRGYATTADEVKMARSLPNVAIWPNRDDLNDIFRRTRVLLMPTLWMESFGLAVVDAMLRGIPVLASDHGGLPEAKLGTDYVLPVRPITRHEDGLGENLLPKPVVPDQTLDPWKKALHELLTDREVYTRHSAMSREVAIRFAGGLSVEPFERLLLNSDSRPAGTAAPVGPKQELTAEQKALVLKRLQQTRKGAARSSQPAIPRAERQRAMPLSFAQERLFFLDRLNPGTAVYNCPSALRVRGDLDLDGFRDAVNALIERHEALRTTFDVVDDRPAQIIADRLEIDIPLTPAESGDEWTRVVGEVAKRPFDLQRGPLLRCQVLQIGAAEFVVLIVCHHIITDGWSSGIMVKELFRTYETFRKHEPNPLPSCPLQYADYAAWQRSLENGSALKEGVEYWKRTLANAPAVLDVSGSGKRGRTTAHQGGSRSILIPSGVAQALSAVGRDNGATLFISLLAAFQMLLHRVTGQFDFVVGSPVANRYPIETEGIVGFFVNTIALRTDLSGCRSFRDVLVRARQTCLDAFTFQHVPFEKVVEELSPERSQSYAPVFQVLFSVRGATEVPRVAGLAIEPLEIHSGTSKFDLNMEVVETVGGLETSLEYDTELFSAATIDHLLASWRILLTSIAANPQAHIGALPTVDEEVPQPAPAGAARTLLDLFSEQVRRNPSAPAVQFGAATVSYDDLNRRANQLAHLLLQHGAGPETPVGISIRRSPEMVIAVLATLKAGAPYVPFDRAYLSDRLELMVADTAPRVILASRDVADECRTSGLKVLIVDSDELDRSSLPAEDPETEILPDSLAYILFTSGSTGRPKGVQLPHRAVANWIEWHLAQFPATSKTLQFSSLSFDASFTEIFSALGSGACLYVMSEEQRRELPGLLRLIAENGIDKLILPYVVLQQLANTYRERPEPRLAIRAIACTAEQLKITPALRGFLHALPGVVLANDYGPTETHVATSLRVSSRTDWWQPEPPIGLPIGGCRAYVLDRYGSPVIPGLPGELFLAGECLGRGYQGRPDLTAERFVPDPFSAEPGARMYRTGDLARLGEHGQFEYFGRIDRQVKIRGMRVEPGEIEATLRNIPGIDDCLVITAAEASDNARLVAYVATSKETAVATEACRKALAAKLPDYMMPAAMIVVASLPLTPNGKLDRAALPVPDFSTGQTAQVEHPRTEIEEKLSKIWAEVLDVDLVGIRDSFFELGGHSLLMIQIASRIRSVFGVEISILSFFEGPTVEQQAIVITTELASRHPGVDIDDLLDRLAELPEERTKNLLQELQEKSTATLTDMAVKTTTAAAEVAIAVGGITAKTAEVTVAASSFVMSQFEKGIGERGQRLLEALLRSAGDATTPPPIAAIGFPSSNRAELLAECIHSYSANLRQFDRQLDFVVTSDPDSDTADREYRQLLERLQHETGQTCWYAGREEKRAFAESIARGGDVPPDIVDFALRGDSRAGKTYGANRNALLLHMAGDLFLSVDDDTSAALYDPIGRAAGIELCSEDGVSEIRVAADRAETCTLAKPVLTDYVGLHEGVLGCTVGDVVARTARATPPGVRRFDPALDADAVNGRILASYNGWLGDSGWLSSFEVHSLSGESWQWVTRSEEVYRKAMESREQVRYVNRLTLTRSREFFVLSGGFDARSLLPPFVPVQRREDVFFGVLVHRCCKDAFLAHLPQMVTHGKPNRRFTLGREVVDFATLLEVAIGASADGSADLPRIGREIEAIGVLAPPDFEHWIDAAVRPTLLAEIQELEKRVRACPPERAFWAREAGQILDIARHTVSSGTLPPPRGFRQQAGESWLPVQDLMVRTGQLLRYWPAMMARAQELRTQGAYLARPMRSSLVSRA